MSQEVSVLLNDLECVLRAEGHWADIPPSIEALSSKEPFCVDTLSCLEWLQWIYIPRLREIMDQYASLPTGAQVQPYIEEALGSMRLIGGTRVHEIVARLDLIMS